MSFEKINNVYFLGIGGIGMSALARFFNAMGKEVSGYDKTQTPLTDELVHEGIAVHFNEDDNLIKRNFDSGKWTIENLLVVYTPAVPKSHSEFVLLSYLRVNMKKRAEVLGLLTEQAPTIAVAGTHGKTTTSSLIAHILITAGVDCSAFLGGITKNYNTNLILSKTLKLPTSSLESQTPIVVEADEYDRSFLTLHPYLAVITSLDPDHLDIYGTPDEMLNTYLQFSRQVKGKLIVNKTLENKLKWVNNPLTYSVNGKADYYATNITITDGYYFFDIITPTGIIEKLTLGLAGLHNVENAVAATAIALQMSVKDDDIRKALKTFEGAKRRFDYQIRKKELVYIDDYAHHPEELRAFISSVKEMYPTKKVTGIFQPHLFSRTRDFAAGFAQSLDLLDECILLDIYPAREVPIEGITSQMLLDKMKSKHKSLSSKKELINDLKNKKIEVLVTLGAGDIDTLVEPIKKMLETNV